MKKLLNGVEKFAKEKFATKARLYKNLAKGQTPLALFITCSDSRIDPNFLTHTEPGELFVLRTAGNIVPPYDKLRGGEAATIEYAISVLKVPDIIICGHSHCGAMAGLLHPESVRALPAVCDLLKYAEKAGRIVRENGDHLDDAARLISAVETNVVVQLEQLQSHPTVAEAVDRGELKLHGWVYHFENGMIEEYDSETKRFAPLVDPALAHAAAS